jgi:hypothetical protein
MPTPKRRSPKPQPPFLLTARDLDLLESVSAARYLAIDALEWLHFPLWRERYAAWQAQGGDSRYMASSHAYRRMRALIGAGYAERVVRTAEHGVSYYQRVPDVYELTLKGAQLLHAERDVPLDQLHYGTGRKKAASTLEHHVLVGRVYAALRCRFEEKPELQFTEWRSEHDFQRDHDRFPVWTPQYNGAGTRQEEGLQPDGAFVIVREGRRSVFFIEVERDQPTKKWRDKIYAYEAYNGSPQVKARYGKLTFTMLGVALNEHHQRRLLEATGESLALLYSDPQRRAEAQQRYYISHMGLVHPTTIGRGWGTLTNVTPVERGGVVPWGVQVETRDHVLIR